MSSGNLRSMSTRLMASFRNLLFPLCSSEWQLRHRVSKFPGVLFFLFLSRWCTQRYCTSVILHRSHIIVPLRFSERKKTQSCVIAIVSCPTKSVEVSAFSATELSWGVFVALRIWPPGYCFSANQTRLTAHASYRTKVPIVFSVYNNKWLVARLTVDSYATRFYCALSRAAKFAYSATLVFASKLGATLRTFIPNSNARHCWPSIKCLSIGVACH